MASVPAQNQLVMDRRVATDPMGQRHEDALDNWYFRLMSFAALCASPPESSRADCLHSRAGLGPTTRRRSHGHLRVVCDPTGLPRACPRPEIEVPVTSRHVHRCADRADVPRKVVSSMVRCRPRSSTVVTASTSVIATRPIHDLIGRIYGVNVRLVHEFSLVGDQCKVGDRRCVLCRLPFDERCR